MKRKDFLISIAKLDAEGLAKKANELAEELMKLNIRHASGQLETPHVLGELRKNLARVLTAKSKLAEGL